MNEKEWEKEMLKVIEQSEIERRKRQREFDADRERQEREKYYCLACHFVHRSSISCSKRESGAQGNCAPGWLETESAGV